MRSTTSLTALVAGLAAVTSAMPTGTTPLEPRWPCVTEYPTYMGLISSSSPNEGANNQLDSTGAGQFSVSLDLGTSQSDCLIAFNIPANSNQCALQVQFPASYPLTASGNYEVNVYTVNSAFPVPGATWAGTQGDEGALFGSVTFSPQSYGATTAYVNSGTCPQAGTVQFRVEIVNWSAGGSVNFLQSDSAGFIMTHIC
jgi:hypothetical protein